MAAATMSPIARSDSSFTTPADASKQQQELPPGVWREVMLQLSTQERFVASMVCKAWRSHALSALTPDLEVSLNSGAAAAGFGHWLLSHSHKLHSLTVTEYYFSHHGPAHQAAGTVRRSRLGQIARVQLWQGLHSRGKPLQELHTLKIKLDDISTADAVAIGLCVMPALTHLTLESNASALGVTGAAALVPLTSLKELVLPSQALGDQGLQYIGNALVNLQNLNVYNDGHVTDDGVGALAGLTALTSLDLQGNVSITQAAMPTLARAVPHLRKLNMSWLAMVNDWGLGQLTTMVDMQDLNLRATGVQLQAQLAVSALQSFTALTRLEFTRCRIAAAGISTLAKAVPSLQELNLSENSALTSYTELLPLKQLSKLTKLDLSSPSTAMRLAAAEHTAVCQLTQLRYLALNSVISMYGADDRMDEWLNSIGAVVPSLTGPQLTMGSTSLCAKWLARSDAAGPIAAALGQGPTAAAGVPPAAQATTATQHCSSGLSPWAEFVMSLSRLTNLTTLEFAGNAGSMFQTVSRVIQLGQPPGDEGLGTPEALGFDSAKNLRVCEPAMLLLAFAGTERPALRSVFFSNADHHHHAPHVAPTRERTGDLSGRWDGALPAVVTAMLLAIAEAQAPQAVERSVANSHSGGSIDGKGCGRKGSARVLNAAEKQRLQVLIHKAQAANKAHRQQVEAGRQMEHQQLIETALEAVGFDDSEGNDAQGSGAQGSGAQGSVVQGSDVEGTCAQGSNQQGSGAQDAAGQGYDRLLSVTEAVEALQLLLPGLRSLHFTW